MIQDNRSKIYKGLSAQTIITVTLGILGIVYFAVMSRLLSKEDFGYFAIITAVTSILASLSEAGLGSAIIQNREANKSYIQTAWTLSLILGFLFCLFLLFTSGIISKLMTGSDILKVGYQIMSLSLIFYAINGVGRAIIIKQLKFLQYGIFDVIAYSLSAVLGIILASKGLGVYSVIWAMLLHQVFLGVQIIIVNKKCIGIEINRHYIKQIITFGGWLTSSVIIRNITDQLDKLITRRWIPVAELGAYNRPTGLISQITSNINKIFDTILFPILSDINNNPQKISVAYQKSVSLIISFSLILTSLFILGDEIIISIFLGSKWLYLSTIFQLVSVSIIFLCYNRIADCFFRSLGIVKEYFYVRCYIMVGTCLCMLFGCQYGMWGLALGLVLSRFVNLFVKVLYLVHYIPFNRFNYYKDLIKSCAVLIILLVICYLIKFYLPYGNYVSVFFYILGITILLYSFPKSLGGIFYDNVFCIVVNKIRKK